MNRPLYAEPRQVTGLQDCAFYHTMEIPGHGVVQGFFDLRDCTDEYLGPVDFTGRRVLEIGPGGGFWTFEMERRGAAEVVSVELAEDLPWDYVPYAHPDFEGWLEGQKEFMHRQKNGFWLAHAAHGSKARVHYGSAYDIPRELGRFDIGTMAAVLLHNRDPMGILVGCARQVEDTLIIVDQHVEGLDDDTTMRLVPKVDNAMVHTWWNLSPRLIREFLPVLGFEVSYEASHTEQFVPVPGRDEAQPLRHFTIVAQRVRELPPSLA